MTPGACLDRVHGWYMRLLYGCNGLYYVCSVKFSKARAVTRRVRCIPTQSRTYEYALVGPRRPEGVDGNIHTNVRGLDTY